MYFAIRHRETKEYVSGTDFRYKPPRCIMADEYCPPKLFTKPQLEAEILHRKINLKKYEVVAVAVIEKND